MAGQLFNQFADLPALETEKQAVIKKFEEIKSGIKELNNLGIKLNAAQSVSAVAGLTQEFEKQNGALSENQKQLLKLVNQIEQANTAEAEAVAQAKVGLSIIKGQNMERAKAIESRNSEYAALQKMKIVSKELAKDIELRVKIEQAEEGSIVKLNLQREKAIRILERLSKEQASSARGRKLENFVTNTTAEIKSRTVADVGRGEAKSNTSKEYADLVKLKIANQENNKAVIERIKIQRAEEGSQVKLNLQIIKATRIYNQLSDAQRSSARGQQLLASITQLSAKVKEVEQATGNFRRNVGNYANSLAGGFKLIADEISRLKTKQAELIAIQEKDPIGFQFSGAKKNLDDTTSALTTLTTAEKKASAEGATLDKQGKVLINTFKTLSSNGAVDKDFLIGFKLQAAEAKDQIADLNDEIKAMSSDTRKLDLLAGAIGSIASTAELATSATALFGGETEDVQKSIQKLVAIQGVANSVRAIATDLTTHGTAANKLYAAGQKLVNDLFGKGVTAATRFSAALKVLGITAVVTGIILLVNYLSKTEDAAKKAEKAMGDLNDELDRNAKINARVDSQRGFSNKAAILDLQKRIVLEENKLKAQLKNAKTDKEREEIQEKINKLKKKGREDEINLDNEGKTAELERTFQRQEQADADLRRLENERDEFIKKRDAKDATLTSDQKFKRKIGRLVTGDEDEEELKGLEERIKIRQEKLQEFKDLYQTQSQDLILSLKAGNNEILSNDEETGTKRVENKKKEVNDLAKSEYELYVQRKEFQKEYNDILLNEDSDVPANFKIQASKKSAALEKDIILATRDFELKQTGLNEFDKQKIRERALKLYLQATQDNTDRILKIRLDALSKERSAAEASAEEFDARELARATARAEREVKILGDKDIKAQTERDNRLTSLNLRYADELAAAKGNEEKIAQITEYYAEKKTKIENDYHSTVLQDQLSFYEKQLELLDSSSTEYLQAQAEIARIKKEMSDIDQYRFQAESDALEDLKKKYEDFYEQVGTVGFQIFASIFDQRKAQIDQQINDIERLKNAEIDRVTKSTDAEQVKAAKITVINAKAQSDQEKLERKKRQLDRQKAVVERSQQIFTIALDTIKTIATLKNQAAIAARNPLLGPAGPVIAGSILAQIPITIASGVLSAAAIAAQPLPAFWKGTDSAPEGYAQLAERGFELSVDRRGKLRVWDKPTVGYLTEGEKVYPHEVSKSILHSFTGSVTSVASQSQSKPIIINNDNNRDDEILEALEMIGRKVGITVINKMPVETTAYYNDSLKK